MRTIFTYTFVFFLFVNNNFLFAQSDTLVFRTEYEELNEIIYDVNDPSEDGTTRIYSITSGNNEGYYKINSKTGKIKIQNIILDKFDEVQMSILEINANGTKYTVRIADGYDYYIQNLDASCTVLSEHNETYVDENSEWTALNNLWGRGSATPNVDFRISTIYKNSLGSGEKVVFLWDVPHSANALDENGDPIFDGASVWSYVNVFWGNRKNVREDLSDFPFQIKQITDLWLDFDFEQLFGNDEFKIAMNMFMTNESYLTNFNKNIGDFFFVFDQKGTYIPPYPISMPDIEIAGADFAVRYDPDSRGDDPDGYERRRVIIKDDNKYMKGKLDIKALFDMFSNEGYINIDQYIYHIQLGLEITDGFGAVRFNKSDIYDDTPLANNEYAFNNNLKVYPNPFLDRVTIDDFVGSLDEVSVYNSVGQKLNIKTNIVSDNRIVFDFKNVKPGVYYIQSGKTVNTIVKY